VTVNWFVFGSISKLKCWLTAAACVSFTLKDMHPEFKFLAMGKDALLSLGKLICNQYQNTGPPA